MKWYVHRAYSPWVGHIVWACPAYRVPYSSTLKNLTRWVDCDSSRPLPVGVDVTKPVHYVIEVCPVGAPAYVKKLTYRPTKKELPRVINTISENLIESILSGEAVPYEPPNWGPLQVSARPPAWPQLTSTRLMRLAQPPTNPPQETRRRVHRVLRRLNMTDLYDADPTTREELELYDVLCEARRRRAYDLARSIMRGSIDRTLYYLPPTALLNHRTNTSLFEPHPGGRFTLLGDRFLYYDGRRVGVVEFFGHAQHKIRSRTVSRPTAWIHEEVRPESESVAEALLKLGVANPHQYEGVLAQAQEHPAFELRRRYRLPSGVELYERRLAGATIDYAAVCERQGVGRGLTLRQALARLRS